MYDEMRDERSAGTTTDRPRWSLDRKGVAWVGAQARPGTERLECWSEKE